MPVPFIECVTVFLLMLGLICRDSSEGRTELMRAARQGCTPITSVDEHLQQGPSLREREFALTQPRHEASPDCAGKPVLVRLRLEDCIARGTPLRLDFRLKIPVLSYQMLVLVACLVSSDRERPRFLRQQLVSRSPAEPRIQTVISAYTHHFSSL